MMVVIKMDEKSQLKEVVVVVHNIHLVKDKVKLQLLLNHLQYVHIKHHETLTIMVLVVLKHPKQEIKVLHTRNMRKRDQLIYQIMNTVLVRIIQILYMVVDLMVAYQLKIFLRQIMGMGSFRGVPCPTNYPPTPTTVSSFLCM